MYAVIETGGKQYRVEVGTEFEVELLDAKAGDTVNLDRILLIADGATTAIGRPIVGDASVSAEVLRQERGVKTISFKYRPKARRRVKKGHRQELHILRIADIVLNGRSAAAEVEQAKSEARTERDRLQEAARRQAAEDSALATKLAERAPATAKAGSTEAPAGAAKAKKATVAKTKAAPETAAETKAPRAKAAGKATPAAESATEPKKRRATKKKDE